MCVCVGGGGGVNPPAETRERKNGLGVQSQRGFNPPAFLSLFSKVKLSFPILFSNEVPLVLKDPQGLHIFVEPDPEHLATPGKGRTLGASPLRSPFILCNTGHHISCVFLCLYTPTRYSAPTCQTSLSLIALWAGGVQGGGKRQAFKLAFFG